MSKAEKSKCIKKASPTGLTFGETALLLECRSIPKKISRKGFIPLASMPFGAGLSECAEEQSQSVRLLPARIG